MLWNVGVQLFQALNGMRVNPRLRNGFPGFAMGGLVTPHVGIPASIASPALPGKSFDLHIGAETFSDLYAPESTVNDLRKIAARTAMRSAGRKPSWYGGR